MTGNNKWNDAYKSMQPQAEEARSGQEEERKRQEALRARTRAKK